MAIKQAKDEHRLFPLLGERVRVRADFKFIRDAAATSQYFLEGFRPPNPHDWLKGHHAMKTTNSVRILVLTVSLLLSLRAPAAPGEVDLSFNAASVTNPVAVVALQLDGKVLIGGPFTFVNGTNRYASSRLNADGSLDGTFVSDSFNPDLADPGPGGYVAIRAVAVQADGKVLVVGVRLDSCDPFDDGCQPLFTSFVTRLNSNGSRDTGFTAFTGTPELSVEETAQTVALQADGKIMVGYDRYGVLGPEGRSLVVRLNADGTRDTNFNVAIGYYGSGVYSIVPQADGKLLIGGSFAIVNGTNRNGMARLNLDGTLDESFNPPVGGYPLALQPDGKILVGGFARLNADGNLDSQFNPGTGAYGVVRSMALQADGKVLLGGEFPSIKGAARPYVARLYGDSPPSLNLLRSNTSVTVSWPVAALNYQLQESTNLALPNAWSQVSQDAVTNGAQISVTVPTSAERKFFRLKSP